jgi:hypothetical protein
VEQTYQVFNPLTGQHTRCASEQAAKELMLDFALQVVMAHQPTVAKEIIHENGDVTWEAVDFASQIKVTL